MAEALNLDLNPIQSLRPHLAEAADEQNMMQTRAIASAMLMRSHQIASEAADICSLYTVLADEKRKKE